MIEKVNGQSVHGDGGWLSGAVREGLAFAVN